MSEQNQPPQNPQQQPHGWGQHGEPQHWVHPQQRQQSGPYGQGGPQFQPVRPKRHPIRTFFIAFGGVIGAFLLIAVVIGIASMPDGGSTATEPVANVPAATPSSDPSTPDDPASAPSSDEQDPSDSGSPDLNDQTARIGDQWYGWTDGVRAKVSTEQVTNPGEFDETAADGTYYKVKVTFKNGSGQALDTSLCSVNVSYGKDGDSADPSFNTDTDSTCEGSILPGRKKSFTFAFTITEKQAQDVVIEVAPDWDHTSAYFTNDGN